MAVLSELEPKKVFEYFEEICSIPHPSYKEERISAYLEGFAKKRNLEYYRDELNNIIIIKEASKGYENEPVIMLQGHMDMVAEQESDCDKNMDEEGLEIYIDGDFIRARGTTLGGDDGIAVAYALAILDDDSLAHPRIEFVCTVCEEVGMEGATGIDVSMCQAKRMINIDSEEEGYFLCGCAGGARAEVNLDITRSDIDDSRTAICIDLSNLIGGHSGVEIDKGRLNANIAVAKIVRALFDIYELELYSINGGAKDNAIPRDARAIITVKSSDTDGVLSKINEIYANLMAEYSGVETEAEFVAEITDIAPLTTLGVIDFEQSKKILDLILDIPNGIIAMSATLPTLVETSLNLGILKTEDSSVNFSYATRSSVGVSLDELIDEIDSKAARYGATVSIHGKYPAWEYAENSKLRDEMVALYEKMYEKAPVIDVMHAGVECGIIGTKISGLDCISIGPDMFDIHTPSERLSISSSKRCYEFICRYLALKSV